MISTNKFTDSLFETLINNFCPVSKYKYWKDLKPDYNTQYETINKLSKLGKYQIYEFIEENNLNKVDQFISFYGPTKRQFEFFK